ncbi:MAG: hypothetical protein KFH87_08595 [Bacteroidetes bacterium]|nr:hypothetical protein [Bacteroidota bacterium]
MRKKCTFIFAVISLLLLLPHAADAIPAFARKYSISCSSCHSMVPKLKDYGEDFAGNAFRLPDAPEPIRTYVDAGDDMLTLHRFFPIAVRFDGYMQYAERDAGKFDFQAPYGVKLMSGASITKGIGYYMYFYMNERGEVEGLEDALLHFSDVFGSGFDMTVGQFQVSDPLFKRELRLTLEDYQLYKMQPAHSHANLTYDRGIMFSYGFDFGLDMSLQLLNGNGIEAARGGVFDIDNGKAVAFHATQHIGPVRIGGFLYRGEELFHDQLFRYEGGAMQTSDVRNVVQYFGPDLTIGNDYIELNAQYLHRIDSHIPFEGAGGTSLREHSMDGILAELVYLPSGPESNWGFVALYNHIQDEYSDYTYHSATLSAHRLLARNLRLVGEVTYDLEEETPRIAVGFVSAF